MKYFKNLSVCFVLLIMMLPVISACSSDDDESVDWNSYILGTWRSYKGTLYYMGETVTVSIDKTGPYSSAYWEMTFKQNGDMKIGYWKPENYTNSFRGSKWLKIRKTEAQSYQLNAYRVLMTRARQGMIICVPKGNTKDHTRLPEYYDNTYYYLKSIGLEEI